MLKIKKGDTIYVITGKDRGKTGKVLRVSPTKGRIMVEGIALQTRHRRPRRAGEKGQRVTIPGMVDISNVKLLCATCNKPTRVGMHIEGGRKQRVCKKCGASVS
ncbi:MAG: 50S ribosomal protein L24 [Armatimonadetes bacterium]|nr:50S ribosomal protein L24 [Armatimonadota bacterium]